jgi:predicted transcriptional regulator
MNANSTKRQVFLEFIYKNGSIRQTIYDHITAKDDQLLTIVALAYGNGTQLSIADLLEIVDTGSRSSIYSRIQKLRDLNMIEYERTGDGYRYQVNPTEQLFFYFDQLGNSMKAIGKMYLKPK